MVTPDSLGNPPQWNMFAVPAKADDYGFVNALVVDLSERLCIDAARIFAAGHSNGSAFVGFLPCRAPYHFASVAMVSAFIPSGCPVDAAAPAVVAVHDTADAAVPYDGGQVSGDTVGIPAAVDTLDQYADHYDCQRPVSVDEAAPGDERSLVTGCVDGSEAVLYTIVRGGHAWPGGANADTSVEGVRFLATDAILDFFDEHPKSSSRGATGAAG